MGMTIEEFENACRTTSIKTAVEEYFQSYESIIVKKQGSIRDIRPMKILCETCGKSFCGVDISYYEEDVYDDKAEKQCIRVFPAELRDLANTLTAIADASDQLNKHLNSQSN